MSNKTVRIADLEDSPPLDLATDPYAPRPKAERQAAWAKRRRTVDEGRRTDDETPVTAIPLSQRAVLLIGVSAGLLVLVLALILGHPSGPIVSPTPAATAPARMFVAPATSPQEARTATEAPTPIPEVMVNAYASPDGLLLGQIETTRQINPVAHYGAGWVAYQDGSGLVWVRAADFHGLALVGPDLAPVPQGRGLPVNNKYAPPAGATPAPAAPPTPAPWPVSAPVVPDTEAPNIKDHFNAPKAPGQEG